jgi:hypothetical protein
VKHLSYIHDCFNYNLILLTPVIITSVNKLLIFVASQILGVKREDILIIDVLKIPVEFQHRNRIQCPVQNLKKQFMNLWTI